MKGCGKCGGKEGGKVFIVVDIGVVTLKKSIVVIVILSILLLFVVSFYLVIKPRFGQIGGISCTDYFKKVGEIHQEIYSEEEAKQIVFNYFRSEGYPFEADDQLIIRNREEDGKEDWRIFAFSEFEKDPKNCYSTMDPSERINVNRCDVLLKKKLFGGYDMLLGSSICAS